MTTILMTVIKRMENNKTDDDSHDGDDVDNDDDHLLHYLLVFLFLEFSFIVCLLYCPCSLGIIFLKKIKKE
jgi:hypothetical protein